MEPSLDPGSLAAASSTSLILIGLIAAAVELLMGIAIGWWLRGGSNSGKKLSAILAADLSDAGAADPAKHAHLHEAEHALTNLQELALRVKADVGAHSSRVEAISNELNAGKTAGPSQEVKVLE